MTSEIFIFEELAHKAIALFWWLAWPLIRIAFRIWKYFKGNDDDDEGGGIHDPLFV